MEAKHTLTNLLVNTYFALAETLDMLMKEIIFRMEIQERGKLKHEFKKQHNLLMKSARDFRARYDLYTDMLKISCLKDKSDYDNGREDANTFMRLVLFYADRCNTPEKCKEVYDLISEMPMNVASNEYINKFHIK